VEVQVPVPKWVAAVVGVVEPRNLETTGDKWPRLVENMAQWPGTYANTIAVAFVASHSATPVACRIAAVSLRKTVVVAAAPIHKADAAVIVAEIRNQAETAPVRVVVTVGRSYSAAGTAVGAAVDSVVMAAAVDCT
jgi:hypothetical protein